MLTKEIDLARQLRLSPFVMNYYGACRGRQLGRHQALAVEGPLVNFAHIVRSSLGWAARLRIAAAFLEMLEFFERKKLVHCDWKLDQVSCWGRGGGTAIDRC